MTLEQRLSLVTLGSADIARSKAFYTKTLGWTPFFEVEDTVFFDLGGLVLSLFAHKGLSEDMKRDIMTAPDAYRGFSLAHNVRSEAEVDAIFAKLRAAGAAILKEPERAPWGGYSGYFADPDGHPWEVAFNPAWTIGADGRLQVGAETTP
jgi:catechol 2,3-dioxygenase-like lactoylglutathione lyase family enzyme